MAYNVNDIWTCRALIHYHDLTDVRIIFLNEHYQNIHL